jgi:hypothetical protein
VAIEVPASKQDFWDVTNQDFAGKQLAPDPEFSELVAIQRGESKGRVALYAVLVVLLAVVGYGAYEYFVEGESPIDQLMGLIHGLFGDDETPQEAPPPPANKEKAPEPAAKPQPAGKRFKVVPGNPYWALPNRRLGPDASLGTVWTPEEEETLRAGLTHKYAYQRYKTVQDVRKARHAGSDVILWDALQDKKFWTRMWAVMGLAEVNVDVELKDLERALGTARSELVADYFERFVHKASPAHLYIMRQAVRVLDERGRLVVLRAIHRSRDQLRNVYMTAAALDPGKQVQAWVKQALTERPVPPDEFDGLKAIIQGQAPADGLLAAVNGHAAPKAKAKPAPKGVRTGEDFDANGNDVGDSSVEFYDQDEDGDGTKQDDDRPDPKTFEYSE